MTFGVVVVMYLVVLLSVITAANVLQDFTPHAQTKKKGPGRRRGSGRKSVVKSESEDSDSKSEPSDSDRSEGEEEEVVKKPAKRGRKPSTAKTDKPPAKKGTYLSDGGVM